MSAALDLFRVGSASIDITPPLEVPYLGWQPRHQRFAGVHDPLSARCAVVEAAGRRIAIISANLIGFAPTLLGPGRSFVTEARARISAAADVPPQGVLLAAAHIHSSPDTLDFRPLRESPGAAAWLESLIDKFGECAAEATRSMFDARMIAVSGALPGLSENRRQEPCLDDRVTLVALQCAADMRRIVLLHFACHPVIVQVQPLVSADYVGMAERFIEGSAPGVRRCLFLQGACGDVNPSMGATRDFRDVENMGRAVGEHAMKLLSAATAGRLRTQPAVVSYVSRRLTLPSRALPRESDSRDVPTHLADEFDARRREGDAPYECKLQVLRLGEVLLAGIPGEPVARLAVELREAARPLEVLTVGYANGYLGYLLPPDMFDKGGYEAQPGPWSKVSPRAHEMVLDALRDAIAEIASP